MSEERAVKSGQFSYANSTHQPYHNVSYFEPDLLKELKRNGQLYLVADAVWGAGGNLASQYAIKKILYDFYRKSIEPDLEKRLLEVIQSTNAAIFERNQQYPTRRPLATTLMAALIHNNKLFVAKVGDSQVYVVWEQSIEQINQENQTADELKNSDPSVVKPQPLSMGLGLTAEVPIEVFSRRLFVGDTVVLCSGSLTGYIIDKEIIAQVTEHAPQEATQHLVEMAHGRGCRDNMAVSMTQILVQLVSQSPPNRVPLPETVDWDSLLALQSSPVNHGQEVARTVGEKKFWQQRKWQGIIAATLLMLLCGVGMIISLLPYILPTNLISAKKTVESPIVYSTETTNTPNSGAEKEHGTSQATITPEIISPTNTADATTPTSPPNNLAISPTPSPEPPPTPTPMPTVEIPPGCTNGARFYNDLTVEDGTIFTVGEKFEKVWLLENKGTCPWAPGYTIRFVDGDVMQEENKFNVPIVKAGTTNAITVSMVAPTKPGKYRSQWQMYDLEGKPFGADLSVQIETVPPKPGQVSNNPNETTLYDFIENAAQAKWSSREVVYTVQQSPINSDLVITAPLGIVVVGTAQFLGGVESEKSVLLTHPHQQIGLIEGVYKVNVPLMPTDILVTSLGFPQAASLNSDGATFEVIFTPTSGRERVLFSKLVKYRESPVNEQVPLIGIEAGQTGTFTLHVLGGESLDYDWALWIDLRLVRR